MMQAYDFNKGKCGAGQVLLGNHWGIGWKLWSHPNCFGFMRYN